MGSRRVAEGRRDDRGPGAAVTCDVCKMAPCDRVAHVEYEDAAIAAQAQAVAHRQRELNEERDYLHRLMERDPGWPMEEVRNGS